ncbi:MAG TPA: cytochrome b/b6 domain-containing protein [Bacteroidales bacterium]|nr:cytochrome b/b6 domain-containing protein [Bacteroidales bacterium]HPE55812.1 cytochrome b/b6 domain-containing protein [Bacteroidales bacterium]HRX96015.1 cytochrome b/b6 domain-containing protein [Bacteroidales bacterium]
MSEEKLYLYPMWLRLWHWTNALLFLVLIITGLSLQYSGVEGAFIRFDIAVTYHNIAGIILTISFAFFLVANRISGNRKFYKVKRKGFIKRLMKQFRYYIYGVFVGEPKPYPVSEKRKFNPLQKLSYIVVMFGFMPLIIITGFGLLFPEINLENVFGVAGIYLTVLLHITVGFGLSVFMIVHIYFCTFGKTVGSEFKSMFTGWH